MEERFTILLKNNIKEQSPSSELRFAVIARVKAEQKRAARVKAFIYGITSIATFVSTFALVMYVSYVVSESGFYQYLSLAFSGDSVVFSYWKELSFSLLESLPVVGMMALLACGAVCIWTAANAFSNTRKFIVTA